MHSLEKTIDRIPSAALHAWNSLDPETRENIIWFLSISAGNPPVLLMTTLSSLNFHHNTRASYVVIAVNDRIGTASRNASNDFVDILPINAL
ncbi:MAG: hypothetical protein A2487_05255 [Candidatus Raymondbacteria bacterium RifOxyC12_full_50_8]|uniref:Uncharacterized protein n=1 Tax=Candidatus Raymondbacteria bacterium RIFOXYD12_FULL_49_13 TaxID=1817890 RepID=A0A1F7FAJ4_UNCRA|nr:MAG: hypothetical protein A2350_20315 [Candidatus Raymondbacteria bacterium RifOxyB12_full_50_8]OGJ92351.1 MAG: hypothetical protein A2248_10375 [Candidatus Raymondbacteria bacterium RIFOXYA2_FULL_49_16]OGJ94977.1 MAG: hypothetical protein A2487_05255 [Candidatus Raymondbacteria bacterium RifOxyC12_full_50_8]OGJ99332.1 MAG: hypothetical protein A2453_13435 [Candidatus Raymondbacteria bacterium RIFOXYC2_FULL_50_21]OGK03653.1 MAG: hypothetical protein A2519_02690 [Candidatus Raymondbacteria ba